MLTKKKVINRSKLYQQIGASIDTRKFLSFDVYASIHATPFRIKAISMAKAHNMVRMYHKIAPYKIEPVLC
jgi:hypothetical protein